MLNWFLGMEIMTVKALCTPNSTKESKREKKVEKLRDKEFEECSTPGFALACSGQGGGEHPLRFKTGPNRSSLNLPSTLIYLNLLP